MADYQLFKKIQLAFNHVRIPFKSEFNFNKSLNINNLTKHNSLQTFVFWTAKEIWFYLPNFSWFYLQVFHPMSICHICNALIISTLPKTPLLLGTSESTQAQAWFFYKSLIISVLQKHGLAMGWILLPVPAWKTTLPRPEKGLPGDLWNNFLWLIVCLILRSCLNFIQK